MAAERMSLEAFLCGRFRITVDKDRRFSKNHPVDPSADDLSGLEVFRRLHETLKPSVRFFDGSGYVSCVQPSWFALQRVARALLGAKGYKEDRPAFEACLKRYGYLAIENGRLAFATPLPVPNSAPSPQPVAS